MLLTGFSVLCLCSRIFSNMFIRCSNSLMLHIIIVSDAPMTAFLNNFQLSSAVVSAATVFHFVFVFHHFFSLQSPDLNPLFSPSLMFFFFCPLQVLSCSLAFRSCQFHLSWWIHCVSCSLHSYRWSDALPFCWRKCSLMPSLGSPCFPRFSPSLCSFGHILFLWTACKYHLDLSTHVHLGQLLPQYSLFLALLARNLQSFKNYLKYSPWLQKSSNYFTTDFIHISLPQYQTSPKTRPFDEDYILHNLHWTSPISRWHKNLFETRPITLSRIWSWHPKTKQGG